LLAGGVQLLDGFIGLYQHDISKTMGPFILAIATFTGVYLNRRPLSVHG
jgi:hypothetical protein